MRHVMIVWVLLPTLLLTACGDLPESREPGPTTVVSLLAAEPKGAALTVYAAAESRNGAPPAVYQGEGPTLPEAMENLAAAGDAVISQAHVEHILLSDPETLDEVLSYAFRDPRQSTESQVWAVRGSELDQIFGEDQDPAGRMAVLKAAAKDHRGFTPLTLREAAAALAAGSPVLLPTLTPADDSLSFAGYTLYKDGAFAARLDQNAALGAALLTGSPIRWTESVGDRAASLEATRLTAYPQWDGETLAGLILRLDLTGTLTGGWQTKPGDRPILEARAAKAVSAALNILQSQNADAADLLHRAGLADPLRWSLLSQQWDSRFPAIPIAVEAELTMEAPS